MPVMSITAAPSTRRSRGRISRGVAGSNRSGTLSSASIPST